MKKIILLGELAEKYKQEWSLDVRTPAEALRAINANRPGFLHDADSEDYIAVLLDEQHTDLTRQITLDNGSGIWAHETLVIVPRICGSTGIEIGAALGAALGVTAASSAAAVIATAALAVALELAITIAISVALSAVASLIAGTPDGADATDFENPENKPSYLYNGVVNTSRQGGPVPIGYGEMIVGSKVLSSRYITKDL